MAAPRRSHWSRRARSRGSRTASRSPVRRRSSAAARRRSGSGPPGRRAPARTRARSAARTPGMSAATTPSATKAEVPSPTLPSTSKRAKWAPCTTSRAGGRKRDLHQVVEVERAVDGDQASACARWRRRRPRRPAPGGERCRRARARCGGERRRQRDGPQRGDDSPGGGSRPRGNVGRLILPSQQRHRCRTSPDDSAGCRGSGRAAARRRSGCRRSCAALAASRVRSSFLEL